MASDVTLGSLPIPAPSVPSSGSGTVHPVSAPTPGQPAGQESASQSAEKAAHGRSTAAFSLQFNSDTQHFFLVARDPVTGAILLQVPPQQVTKEFEPNHGAARGAKINSSV